MILRPDGNTENEMRRKVKDERGEETGERGTRREVRAGELNGISEIWSAQNET